MKALAALHAEEKGMGQAEEKGMGQARLGFSCSASSGVHLRATPAATVLSDG